MSAEMRERAAALCDGEADDYAGDWPEQDLRKAAALIRALPLAVEEPMAGVLTDADLAAIERGGKIGDAGAIWLLLRSHRALGVEADRLSDVADKDRHAAQDRLDVALESLAAGRAKVAGARRARRARHHAALHADGIGPRAASVDDLLCDLKRAASAAEKVIPE